MELGIPCYYCVGYAGENHAWNIVGLDDGYYHVDVTWDTPLPGYESMWHYYAYFNITDAKIQEDHTRDSLSVFLPACEATGYAYTASESGEAGAAFRRSPEEAGYAREQAISSLDAYYSYCEQALFERGEGTHTLTMLVANDALLEQILQVTETGDAMDSYAAPAARRMGWDRYWAEVLVQSEALTDGYYLLTQQVQLASQWPEDEGKQGELVPAA